MKGSVDLRGIKLLKDDPKTQDLFLKSQIIVAEINNEICGFGGYKGNHISWLFVHPGFRQKGIGKALLTEILRDLQGEVRLNVAKNNVAAKKLYKSFGFSIEKEFTGNFNGYESKAITLVLKNNS